MEMLSDFMLVHNHWLFTVYRMPKGRVITFSAGFNWNASVSKSHYFYIGYLYLDLHTHTINIHFVWCRWSFTDIQVCNAMWWLYNYFLFLAWSLQTIHILEGRLILMSFTSTLIITPEKNMFTYSVHALKAKFEYFRIFKWFLDLNVFKF